MAENYITLENISKSFGEKELFSSIGFGINKGQKLHLSLKIKVMLELMKMMI